MAAIAVVAKDGLYRDGYLVRGLNRLGFDAEGFASEDRLFRRLLMKPFDVLVIEIEGEGERDLETARYLRGVASSKIAVLGHMGKPGSWAGIADAWFDKDVRVEALASTLRCLALGTPVRDSTIPNGWRLSEDARHLVSPYGGRLPLNAVERQLLARLMATPDALVSYAELVDASMRDEDGLAASRRRLSLLISRLQQKVAARFGSMLPIRLIRGRGVRYQTAQGRPPKRQ